MGGLQGNWALVLLLYAALLVVAMAAHLTWVYRLAGELWRSNRSLSLRLAGIVLASLSPVFGYYALILFRHIRQEPRKDMSGKRCWIMPVIGLCAVLVCAGAAELRYSPGTRSWSHALQFIPGFLALYGVMQAVLHMAARVFGVSQRGVLATRIHGVSAVLLLATSLMSG